jgi:hypothetical protein
MLPIALVDIIARLFGSKHNFMDMFTGGKPDDYATFGNRLGWNQGQQGVALNALAQALPYAESKEELGQILNMYRNYAGTTQNAPLTPPSGVYNVTTIPGMSGSEHGGSGPGVDWGPATAGVQNMVDWYRQQLPGSDLLDLTTYPTAHGDQVRLWQQFLDREGTAPPYSPGIPAFSYGGDGEYGFERQVPAIPVGPNYGANPMGGPPLGIPYGQPGYDYASVEWPEPGQFFGTPFQGSAGGGLSLSPPMDTAPPLPSSGPTPLGLTAPPAGGGIPPFQANTWLNNSQMAQRLGRL